MGKDIIYEFDYMWENEVCSRVKLKKGLRVEVLDYTGLWYKSAFGLKSDVKYGDLLRLFERRCFPKDRVNAKELLSDLGLEEYSLIGIIRKTHGVLFGDKKWIRFSDESSLTWSDVDPDKKIRELEGNVQVIEDI